MNRKWLFLIFILFGTTLTSGCWDKKELNDIAIVSAVGIDKSKEGNLMGSFQMINPGNVTGALQGGGSGDSPSTTVFTSTGDSVVELDRHASIKVSRFMYLPHANLVVISEELAKEEGIIPILDAFDRSPSFRTTTNLVIARDVMAKDIVETLTVIDKVSAEKVIKTLKSTEELHGESISVNIQDVIKGLVSTGREPVISGITIKKNREKEGKIENTKTSIVGANPETAGIAIFKNGKLVDWLNGEKAKGALWVLGKIKSTNIYIDWKNKKDAISYQVVREKTNVKVKMKKGKPTMIINVRAEGDIRESNVPIDLSDPHVLLDIEKKLEKDLKKQMEAVIVQAQKNKADIFGFGERVHQSNPKEWKRIEKDWQDVSFPKVKVDVKVETFVRRTGLRNKPFISDLNGDK